MGYWNKTCMLSNLHIIGGTPVYVVVLEQNDIFDRCHTTSFWRPIVLPFLCEYDDYGGGKNSNDNINHILDSLKNRMIEVKPGNPDYQDLTITPDTLNEDMFFVAVNEGWLKVAGPRGARQIDFAMIRKDVVDYFCENWIQRKYVGDQLGTGGFNNAYIEYKFNDVVPAADQLWSMSSYQFSTLVNTDSLVNAALQRGDHGGAQRLLNDVSIVSFIDTILNNTRKLWIPGCHEGSQAVDDQPYRILVQSICNVLDQEQDECI